MLFQEHGGHDDQRSQGKGGCFYKFFISQCFAVCKRHMYCKRVEYMNAGQDIRRSICTVQPFYYICEDIVSWKFCWTYVLSIWINIGNNQENSHSHHKIKCQLIVAGLYEFPNVEGKLSMDEVTEYSKTIGLMPVRVQELPEAKHIFSHIEWHMTGYEVIVDELEKTNEKGFLFIHPEEIRKEYSIPSAFEKYTGYAGIER